MTPPSPLQHKFGIRLGQALGAIGLTWLSGCSTPPAPVQATAPVPVPVRPQVLPEPPRPEVPMPERLIPEALAVSPPPSAAPSLERRAHRSLARNAQEYRKDAASHLYAQYRERVFKGRLPPMLEAVGVVQVNIDQRGGVQSIHWQRAPRHAPQVMREIERLVRAAAPYPAPVLMSQVTYTDVWLWHKSGRFQLDTLTEGQD